LVHETLPERASVRRCAVEPKKAIPCRCGKVMVNVGDARREGDTLVEFYYHCPKCHAQATLCADGTPRADAIPPEAMRHLIESGVLTAFGTAGDKYPHSWLPVDK
jgi:hypothetical protein